MSVLALDPLEVHFVVTASERRILRLVGAGKADAEIQLELKITEAALRSCLRRFRDRTGLAGRLLAVWARVHQECCLAMNLQ